ncbi:hypothetical protein OAI_08300 [Vibrio cyclitrophicus FF160]|uniref:hypothetical protein n=1 Tax=Vibrio cyclitrophicus TaxID=47951 RepID=UPI00031B527B|nr:hypothetical protein [Vibrio cyclitrophicus]OEE82890.1 hypothetical protein OAI_08300 [Vibrio cyclitrophicus FF160]PMJ17407.1 hypothetical protein BCU28_04740 [Vibrio cyclitrophicus]
MFAVSNYYKYELVDAESSLEAALLFTGKRPLKLLSSEELNDESAVIVAMCLRYTEEVELLFESLDLDIDRVLFMGEFDATDFYSLI